MNTLAEKLADAWIKKDLIDVKSDDFPKSRKESHLIQEQFHKFLSLRVKNILERLSLKQFYLY